MKPRRKIPELSPQQAQRVVNKAMAVVRSAPRPDRFEVPLRNRGGRTIYIEFETKDFEISGREFVTMPVPVIMTWTIFEALTQ